MKEGDAKGKAKGSKKNFMNQKIKEGLVSMM